MKLNNEKRILDKEGFDSESRQFNIKQSVRAFEILSSNIYSDKILAVVREYGTNALDAHVMVDAADKPFDIHIPNNFEPYFSIRDYGPGLSESDVTQLYTTYFHSTKDDSNDVTGCLGLGSKSAFAYTDQFTVTSFFGGMKKVFTAYIAESGVPEITKVAEEPSTEANGMEIYIPVKNADFSTFKDRVSKVFRRFPVAPKFTGGTVELNIVKYLLSGPNYKVRDEVFDRYNRTATCYAIQGPIAYPIELSELGEENLSKDAAQLLKTAPIDITFPMGTLGITASRERLDYNKQTKKNLIEAIDKVVAHLPTHLKDVLATAKTEWEARCLHYEWMAKNNESYLKYLTNGKLIWNGKEISRSRVEVKLYDEQPMVDQAGKPVMKPFCNPPVQDTQRISFARVKWYDRHKLQEKTTSAYSEEYSLDIDCRNNTVVIVEDTPPKGGLAPAIRHNFGGPNSKATRENQAGVVTIACDKSRLQNILDQMGNPPYILSSSLTPAPKQARVVNGTQVTVSSAPVEMYKVKYLSNWGGYTDGDKTNSKDVTGGTYFLTYSGTIKALDTVPNAPGGGNFERMCGEFYTSEGLNFPPLFRVNWGQKDAVVSNPNWTSLETFMRGKIKELDTKQNHEKLQKLAILVRASFSGCGDACDGLAPILSMMDNKEVFNINLLSKSSKFRKIFDEALDIVESSRDILGASKEDSVGTLAARGKKFLAGMDQAYKLGWIKKDYTQDSTISKGVELRDKVMSLYPCLMVLVYNRRTIKNDSNTLPMKVKMSDIMKYIMLCDAKPKIARN